MTMFASQWLANPSTEFTIDQSIRFNSADSAYLEKTYSSSESTLTAWSFSAWVKRSLLADEQFIFQAGTTSANLEYLRFTNSDEIEYKLILSSSVDANYITEQLFVDPGAWMHIYAYRSSTTFKLYINGSEVTDFSTSNAPGSSDGMLGKNVRHRIGTSYSTISNLFGGYLAEMNFVPGTAKAVTDFGETDSDSGQWTPVKYAGSYGTNGFYLKGQDSSALGDDSSGNGNDFTSSGLAAADQVSDSPTDNYATLNPLLKHNNVTFADGNLEVSSSSNGWFGSVGTVGIQLGDKVYFEGKCLTNVRLIFGLSRVNGSGGTIKPDSDGGFETAQSDTDYMWRVTSADTVYYQTTDQSVTVSAVSVNDIVGCSVDTDGTVKFYKNGTEIHSFSTTLVAGDTYMPVYSVNGATSTEKWEVRFGSTSISHQPAGFSLLRTSDMDDPTISDGSEYYHPQLYTGTGVSGLSVTNDASAGDFKPDILWLAPRSNGDNKVFFDSVRGTTQRVKSNSSDAEDTDGTAQLTFESDGFDLDTTDVNFNGSGRTYVAWQWHTTGGTTSSNTDGDITSTVSANTTSGVAVLTYTGNGSDNQTIGHGIGIAPKMIITKRRDSSGNWTTYHDAVGINKAFYLNLTNAPSSNTEQYRAVPTSSVYTVGVGGDINSSGGTYVSFVFAEVEGFSKFGSYEGNGSASNGPFVYTGFKPRWVLFRRYDATEGWTILDTARGSANFGSEAGSGGTNPTAGNDLNAKINANDGGAEEDNPTGSRKVAYLANGFKLKTTNTAMNTSGGDYLYMAFAECPFKVATAR